MGPEGGAGQRRRRMREYSSPRSASTTAGHNLRGEAEALCKGLQIVNIKSEKRERVLWKIVEVEARARSRARSAIRFVPPAIEGLQ